MANTDPDFTLSCGHYGGNLIDVPLPHIRQFGPHSPARRHVRLKMMSWVGVAPGAAHVHISFDIERNSIWDRTKWRRCWDDDLRPYQELPGSDDDYTTVMKGQWAERVTKWVRTQLALFPADRFRVTDDDAEDTTVEIDQTWTCNPENL